MYPSYYCPILSKRGSANDIGEEETSEGLEACLKRKVVALKNCEHVLPGRPMSLPNLADFSKVLWPEVGMQLNNVDQC